jgi:hypothetical protein
MVKTNADLKTPEIIRSVCTDFLNLVPEILAQVPYDPALEAAVDSMELFPPSRKRSKAADALAQLAVKVIKESMLPRSDLQSQSEPANQGIAEESLLGQLSYSH